MPTDSYLRSWISLHQQNFPDLGWEAEVYSGALDHTGLPGLEKLTAGLAALQADRQFVRGVDSWWTEIKAEYRFISKYRSRAGNARNYQD